MAINYRREDQRIARHLQRAERLLRAKDVGEISPAIQIARLRNLNYLHDYWIRGEYPRNTDRAFWRVPCFIDRNGRTCAVAYLMVESGHLDLAGRIDKIAHNARLRKMKVPGLAAWVEQSGLTTDELALIQPGYNAVAVLFWTDVIAVPAALVIGLVGSVMIGLNRATVLRNRRGLRAVAPGIIGLIIAAAALYAGFLFTSSTVLLTRYFFGLIPVSDLGSMGTGTLADSSQSAMAIPLLILVISTLVMLLVGGWSLLSSVRALRTLLKPAAIEP